jgi:hypothetical protein
MWTLIIILLAAASLAPLAAPVEAVDLVTGPLDGDYYYCTATNKSGATLTMTLQIVAGFLASNPGTPLKTCGPMLVPKKTAAICNLENPGLNPAYCKITTSSGSGTRGNLMVLDAAFNATVSSEAR